MISTRQRCVHTVECVVKTDEEEQRKISFGTRVGKKPGSIRTTRTYQVFAPSLRNSRRYTGELIKRG